jgi:N-acetyl-gamma-glutamyl-phosphate reductase
MKSPVPVGIVGASGYSGEELVRLLLSHPQVELTAVTSRQSAGQTVAQVFPKFASHPRSRTLRFSEPKADLLAKQAEIVFLALPHGVAAEFALPLLDHGCRVIDLSADFRLKSAQIYKEFYGHDHPAPDLLKRAVYGLPEVYRDEIKSAMLVASPGCYPTSILLPLIPLLRSRLIQASGIIADSLSGVSGAGRKAELDYLFVECNESVRPYGLPKHRHLYHALSDAGKAPHRRRREDWVCRPSGELLRRRVWPGAVRPIAGRQSVAGYKERRWNQCSRNRVAHRPAHWPPDRAQRRG